MNDLVITILSSAFSIQLPYFGFSFGIMCVALWTLPMLIKFLKSIF